MARLFRLYYSVLSSTGLIYLALLMILMCFLMSGAQGFNYTVNRGMEGLTGFSYFSAKVAGEKLASPSILYFITYNLFIIPLILIKKGNFGLVDITELSLSLPVTRAQYVISRFVYTLMISIAFISLFTLAAFIGVHNHKYPIDTESRMLFERSLVILLVVGTNLYGVGINAIYLSLKKYKVPYVMLYLAVFTFYYTIKPEMLYRIVTVPFFWPLLVLVFLVFNGLCLFLPLILFKNRDV